MPPEWPRSPLAVTVRRAVAAVLGAFVLVALTASPAMADPAKPGRYRGEVVGVEPATDAITVEVVGGDAFFDLEVDPGHTVVVVDYNQDPADPAAVPYLRFQSDGTVEENRNSLSAATNGGRFTAASSSSEPGTSAPAWQRVAGGGHYTWHDHRAHWMLPEPPSTVSPGDVLPIEGRVPLVVDGSPVVVQVEDRLQGDVSPIPWWAGAAVTAAVLIGLGLRLPAEGDGARTLAAGAALVAGLAAAGVAVAEWRSLPEVAFSAQVPLSMAIVGLLAAVVGLLLRRRTPGAVAVLASAACSAGWVLSRLAVFDQPVLVTRLAPAIDRTGTALALGLAVAAAAITVQRGGLVLRLPDLGLDGVDEGGSPAGGPAESVTPHPRGGPATGVGEV